MDLKSLVDSIKNLIKNEGNQISLIDINGNSVLFSVATVEDIVEGINAEPDGEFYFNDGLKVVVEGGVVKSIEKVEEVKEEEVVEKEEEVIENSTKNEEVVEEVEKTETVIEEEQPKEDEKDVLIRELQSKVEELKSALEVATKVAEEKTTEIESISKDLEEIKNFYSKVNHSNDRGDEPTKVEVQKQSGFRYARKK